MEEITMDLSNFFSAAEARSGGKTRKRKRERRKPRAKI